MAVRMTVELDDATASALDDLARNTARSRESLVEAALRDYVELRAWQIEKIAVGLAAAERGEFASDDLVRATFRKHGVRY
jgi:predicted transcriptional regulator